MRRHTEASSNHLRILGEQSYHLLQEQKQSHAQQSHDGMPPNGLRPGYFIPLNRDALPQSLSNEGRGGQLQTEPRHKDNDSAVQMTAWEAMATVPRPVTIKPKPSCPPHDHLFRCARAPDYPFEGGIFPPVVIAKAQVDDAAFTPNRTNWW